MVLGRGSASCSRWELPKGLGKRDERYEEGASCSRGACLAPHPAWVTAGGQALHRMGAAWCWARSPWLLRIADSG